MTSALAVFLAAVVSGAWCAQASVLQVLPQRASVEVFPGARTTEVQFRNSGPEPFSERLNFRLYQLSSATAMPVADWMAFKPLTVLAGQTVLESIEITVPAVRARTRFEIRWADAAGTSIGATVLTAYPSNILGQLVSVSEAIGIHDPQFRIKPLLARSGVATIEVHRSSIENFSGPAIIAAAFDDTARDAVLEKKLLSAAEHGARVVSISPSASSAGTLLVVHGATGGRIAFANARDFATIDQNPGAQLLLVDLVRLVTKTNLHPFQAKL